VCNSDHCDTIPRPEKVDKPQLLIYTSNKSGSRFEQTTGQFEQSNSSTNQIRINADQKFQTILGWGGAFTDAAGINLDSLNEQLQEKLLRSYFADDGIEYSLCRVPIGGTDFSTRGYSYDDGDVDEDLVNFCTSRRRPPIQSTEILKGFKLDGVIFRRFLSSRRR
jgi:glucosylceramidase